MPPNTQARVRVPLLGHTFDDVLAPRAATFEGVEDGDAVYAAGPGDWRCHHQGGGPR